jgi:hypothetical protein
MSIWAGYPASNALANMFLDIPAWADHETLYFTDLEVATSKTGYPAILCRLKSICRKPMVPKLLIKAGSRCINPSWGLSTEWRNWGRVKEPPRRLAAYSLCDTEYLRTTL